MEIPKSIKIGGHLVPVKLTEQMTRDRNHYGESNLADMTIEIDSSLSKSAKGTTFLHEIIEHINYMNELCLEHKQISVLESALYQVLVDNKLKF